MICFNCGINLHSKNMKECPLCGVRLGVSCPFCHSSNPLMAGYCMNCGKGIAKLEPGSSVRNFETLSENRKNVAVVFADVSGFTAMAEKLDPEEVREIINDCFGFITRPVYEMEGTIDKYIGDCVMILFGARYSHGDDARRAVICAMRMLELVNTFSEERLSSRGLALNLSVGVNYGLVVTGSIGNYYDKDYTVMGDIVNTAQRLQAKAEKGSILVAESVFIETGDVISYSKMREIIVKNKDNPVRCYVPMGVKPGYSLRQDAVFVGRELEMGLLNSYFNNALNTGTKCIIIKGDVGIGKTRILKEFSSKIGSGMKQVWVECSSTTGMKPYNLLSGILMNIMNISPDDSTNAKKYRLKSFLEYIMTGYTDDCINKTYNFNALVLGLERENEFQTILNSMELESIRREILSQLALFFECMCRKYRLLVVVDDIHWADSYSLSILMELIPLLDSSNILFLMAMRYETELIAEIEKGKQSSLRLEPLDESDISAMLCTLLECSRVDVGLLEAAQRFSGGNPLFVREFASHITRMDRCYRTENGTLCIDEQYISLIPNSIQSIILSNVDLMGGNAGAVLQAAAVCGREFSSSMLRLITDDRFDVQEALKLPLQHNLISLKKIQTVTGSADKIFTFNNDLEREVIYDSILNKYKKELHQKFGELIEKIHINDIEVHYEELYRHFERAGQDKKAGEYYYMAAVKHKNDFNMDASLECFEKFLSLFMEGDEAVDTRISKAYREMATIHSIAGRYNKALECLELALMHSSLPQDIYAAKILIAGVYKDQGRFDEALLLLDETEPRLRQNDALLGKLLQMKCNIMRIVGNSQAPGYAKKSEKILLKLKDYHSLAETMNQAGIIFFNRGDIDNAVTYLEKSYTYAQRVKNLAVMVRASGNLGAIYHATGRISDALELFTKSIQTAGKISNLQGYISGTINLGILHLDKGLFNKAESLFKEALKISVDISSKLYECISLTNLGDIMFERGEWVEALEFYTSSLEIARSISLTVEEAINYLGIARIYIKRARFEEAETYMDKARDIFMDTGETSYICDYLRCRSIYKMEVGKLDEAYDFCEQSISFSIECSSDTKKLKALRLKGRLLVKMGEAANALAYFHDSIDLAEGLESDYEAAKGYYERALAYDALNMQENALEDALKADYAIKNADTGRWTKIISDYEFRKK